jgi:hypothetical protein
MRRERFQHELAAALSLSGAGPVFNDRMFSASPETRKHPYYFAPGENQSEHGRDKQHYRHHENKLYRIHIVFKFNCSNDIK